MIRAAPANAKRTPDGRDTREPSSTAIATGQDDRAHILAQRCNPDLLQTEHYRTKANRLPQPWRCLLLGWSGDRYRFARQAARNFHMPHFLTKIIPRKVKRSRTVVVLGEVLQFVGIHFRLEPIFLKIVEPGTFSTQTRAKPNLFRQPLCREREVLGKGEASHCPFRVSP